MKRIVLFFGLIVLAATAVHAQNYKIKQTTSVMGQNISSTVYVKGSRKRTEQGGMMGMGGDVANIEQCDLRRTVHVNDKRRLYTIEPFATDSPEPATPAARPTKPAATKVTKGGTLTMSMSINDTGERKQMFGLTARHIKTSMTMQPSADACTKQTMNMETDGWYVDLPQFSCPITPPTNPNTGMGGERGGCQDRIIMKYSGGGKMGFPLQVTQSMNNEGQSFSTTLETVEFSKTTLDDALFDLPAGYSLASSSSDLYKPDYGAMAEAYKKNPPANNGSVFGSDGSFGQSGPSQPAAKRPGTKRIGVLIPSNQTTENVSGSDLQSFLVQRLTSGNIDAVAVRSEAEARAAGCDFLLSNDVSKLKLSTASKIGGIFGKVTNSDTGGKSYDAQVDYSLKSLSSGQSVVQNKAAGKTSGDANTVVKSMMTQEVQTVLSSIR